jgi:hypothetical protein
MMQLFKILQNPLVLLMQRCLCAYLGPYFVVRGIDYPSPRVNAFLADIFNADDELIEYVQRLYGYAVNGRTREEICIFNLGKGGESDS